MSFARKDSDYSVFENRTMGYYHWPTAKTVISTEWFKSFEQYNLDQVIGRETIVEINSRGLCLLGKRQINNITVGNSETLLQIAYDFPRPVSIDDRFIEDILIPFRDSTTSYGGSFYYMNIYPRHLHFWSKFPYHNNESPNEYWASNLLDLKKMQSIGIRTIDTFENISCHANEYLYFYTDHHYTYKGAYYSYQALLKTINADNPDKDTLCFPDLEEMTAVTTNGYFWGSLISQIGNRTFEGRDYLEYALPNDYPIEFDRFESGVPSSLPIIRNDLPMEYGCFMSGDHGNTVIKTHRPELPSILIIGCSYTDALEVLAIYNFNEVHSIDPRLYDGDIGEYIRNSRCDYVIVQDVISLDND